MTTYGLFEDTSQVDCLIVPMFEGTSGESVVASLDIAHGGSVSRAVKLNDVEGKKFQTSLLYTDNTDVPRILLIGLGKKEALNIRTWKHVVGAATIAMQGKTYARLSLHIPAEVKKQFGTKRTAEETTVAITLASYAFDEHKSDSDARMIPIESVMYHGIVGNEKRVWRDGVETGKTLGMAINKTRHLANTPPSIMTPAYLAAAAQDIAKAYPKVRVKVLSKADAEKIGMGCFLGVSQGSALPPKFIIMEYLAGKKTDKPTVLVGKGITFDSGGLSLKPSNYMTDMKFDMLGAATVLGTIQASAALGLKKNIVGLMPACENMPSGSSYRPDDILTNMEGKTVEIDNTDAEGRLILCDALSYAKQYNPKEVIDLATLTGACMVAIGNERSGLFSRDERLVASLREGSEAVGEQLWHLPLGEEYTEAMKSEVADIKNTGDVGGRGFGGASTAAAFLEFFTKKTDGSPAYPWAHIDLSCSHYGGKGKPWIRGGANGFGIQTLIEHLR